MKCRTSLVSVTLSSERERVLLEYKIICAVFIFMTANKRRAIHNSFTFILQIIDLHNMFLQKILSILTIKKKTHSV